MFAGACRIAAALAMLAVPFVAVAQVIPPSEQPGRARQQFIEPQAPQAHPAGPAVALPSTVAPHKKTGRHDWYEPLRRRLRVKT
jgi:hypothetical protein